MYFKLPRYLRILFAVLIASSINPIVCSASESHISSSAEQTFPIPLDQYDDEENNGIVSLIKNRAENNKFNLIAALIFLGAIFHTFMAARFQKMAHEIELKHQEKIKKEGRTAECKPHENAIGDVSFKAELFEFLGEVEAIFGIWVIPLAFAIISFEGWNTMIHYIGKTVDYTEPLFVVIIMTIAATRPILKFAEYCTSKFANFIGKGSPAAWWISILTIGPILGSFITEPAAMTISALLLCKKFYDLNPCRKFAYATIGLLFVNISIGGTLTNFAAPPVLMVAQSWDWSTKFMLLNFGWKAVIGIIISNGLYYFYFRKEFSNLNSYDSCETKDVEHWADRDDEIPIWVTIIHLIFMGWTVLNAHYPALFIGGFLFFLAFTKATFHHQNVINLRPAILVGFFLAGLKIHGECQGWWISPVLMSLTEWPLMIGATVLTAFNDNAAITFLASQVPGFSEELKYAVMAGAVTGGGLTVIANAPNPAGQSILSRYFPDGISPMCLAAGALIPTIIAGCCFMLIR